MSESHNLVIYAVNWPVSDPIGSTDLEGLIRFFTAYWTEDQMKPMHPLIYFH